MSLTDEQESIVEHPPDRHARVLAGPGTGKSYTAVALLERLGQEVPDLKTRMLTFTRAATADFARKLGDADLGALGGSPPSTIHAFALSLLMRQDGADLPTPLRIPDTWETKNLIRDDLSRSLKARGYNSATPTLIEKLELEMGAAWESLDEDKILLTEVDPELRSAYIGAWRRHREVFGYSLLAELPYRAGPLLEDVGPSNNFPDLLLVDEYQDLNEADIRLVKAAARAGVTVLAIGDDDQSIYGFRNAAPEGIRRFLNDYEPADCYELTVSQRCGAQILDAANQLIASAPERPPKTPVTPGSTKAGRFEYLRFGNETTEARGIARMICGRLSEGVDPSDITVLVRSSRDQWTSVLQPQLRQHGVELASTAWVAQALQDQTLRRGIALAHLTGHREDSLAWWTLLDQANGVGPRFVDYVVDQRKQGETFGCALLRLYENGFPESPKGHAPATACIGTALTCLEELNVAPEDLDERGWGGLLLDWLDEDQLSEDALSLLQLAGENSSPNEGLKAFVSQLEPFGKDLASATDGRVRLMTMSEAKGLTLNTCFVMGVEEGLIPFPRGDVDEERRLLYVAVTRATDLCVLTWAQRRKGPLARAGSATLTNRQRSSLLVDLAIGSWRDGEEALSSQGL